MPMPTQFDWGGDQIEPSAGLQANGYDDRDKPAHQTFNWLFGILSALTKITGEDIPVSESDPTSLKAYAESIAVANPTTITRDSVGRITALGGVAITRTNGRVTGYGSTTLTYDANGRLTGAS